MIVDENTEGHRTAAKYMHFVQHLHNDEQLDRHSKITSPVWNELRQ